MIKLILGSTSWFLFHTHLPFKDCSNYTCVCFQLKDVLTKPIQFIFYLCQFRPYTILTGNNGTTYGEILSYSSHLNGKNFLIFTVSTNIFNIKIHSKALRRSLAVYLRNDDDIRCQCPLLRGSQGQQRHL